MTANRSAQRSATQDTDAVLETLANERRRVILRSLEGASGNQRSVEALVDDVVDGVSAAEPSEEVRQRRVYTELYHSHLPALEELDMIVHDPDEDVVWGDTDESTRKLLDLIEEYEASR